MSAATEPPEIERPTTSPAAPPRRTRKPKSKSRVAFGKWTRVLHLYGSMFGLVCCLFFAVTGVLLNHADVFEPSTETDREITFTAAQLSGDRLAIAETVRAATGANGAVVSFDEADGAIRVAFRAPGHATDVSIDRATGVADVHTEGRGAVGWMNDLHRGKGVGAGWKWAIDLGGVILALIAFTGLAYWALLPRSRVAVLLTVGVSVVIAAALYAAAV
jgi:hypothetical protein